MCVDAIMCTGGCSECIAEREGTAAPKDGRIRMARSIQQSLRAAGYDVPIEKILNSYARIMGKWEV